MNTSSGVLSSPSEPIETTPHIISPSTSEMPCNLTTSGIVSLCKSADESTTDTMVTKVRKLDRSVKPVREMEPSALTGVKRKLKVCSLCWYTNASNGLEEPTLTQMLITFIELSL